MLSKKTSELPRIQECKFGNVFFEILGKIMSRSLQKSFGFVCLSVNLLTTAEYVKLSDLYVPTVVDCVIRVDAVNLTHNANFSLDIQVSHNFDKKEMPLFGHTDEQPDNDIWSVLTHGFINSNEGKISKLLPPPTARSQAKPLRKLVQNIAQTQRNHSQNFELARFFQPL